MRFDSGSSFSINKNLNRGGNDALVDNLDPFGGKVHIFQYFE